VDAFPVFGNFRDIAPFIRSTPEKREAYRVMRLAIRRGELARQPCEKCGATDRIHAHHPDYDKPLDVIWLCAMHHAEWHRINGLGLNGGDPPMLIPGGYDLSGRRFGGLTVLRKSQFRNPKGDLLWLCVCDCGKKVARRAGSLQQAAATGSFSACKECNRARRLAARRYSAQHYSRVGEYGWGLYTVHGLDRYADDIRRECGKELGCLPELFAIDELGSLKSGGLESWMTGDGDASDDDAKDGDTLTSLGKEMGVTRERVRQLEERAMLNLQRRARAFLNPLRNPTTGKILPPLPPVRRQAAKQYARAAKQYARKRRARQKAAA